MRIRKDEVRDKIKESLKDKVSDCCQAEITVFKADMNPESDEYIMVCTECWQEV